MKNTKWGNVIRGVAYGDAWGDKNEFRSYEGLTADNPMGPELPHNLRITDDTQMSLSLARALNGASDMSPNMLRARVLDEWVAWYKDPDNNRAPGRRCMAACRVLAHDGTWMDATDDRGDGCGTVMRTSPAAFLPHDLWAPVAAWQAISTHGGANGVAAALVGTAAIRAGAGAKTKVKPTPGTATKWATDFTFNLLTGEADARKARLKEVGRWLAWAPGLYSDDTDDQVDWVCDGLQGLIDVLRPAEQAVAAFQKDPWAEDPCQYGGEGWRAHECLATALLAVDTFPKDPVLALRRATVTGGDSDSIAGVAGGILGAIHDLPWPAQWFERLEPRYQVWIAESETYTFDGSGK